MESVSQVVEKCRVWRNGGGEKDPREGQAAATTTETLNTIRSVVHLVTIPTVVKTVGIIYPFYKTKSKDKSSVVERNLENSEITPSVLNDVSFLPIARVEVRCRYGSWQPATLELTNLAYPAPW